MTPSWLTHLLAALMLVVAAYCAGRIAFARLRQRPTEYDIDVVHLVMGVAMAGMLVPSLDIFSSNRVWEVFFALAAAWFAVRIVLVLRGMHASRTAIDHCGPHLIAALAMLYMYFAPAVAASGTSGGMAGMGGVPAGVVETVRYPSVGLLLAAFLIGYSVLVADRTNLTTATLLPATADPTQPASLAPPAQLARPSRPLRRPKRSVSQSADKTLTAEAISAAIPVHDVFAPRALNSYLIVMSLTMAYMLIIML